MEDYYNLCQLYIYSRGVLHRTQSCCELVSMLQVAPKAAKILSQNADEKIFGPPHQRVKK